MPNTDYVIGLSANGDDPVYFGVGFDSAADPHTGITITQVVPEPLIRGEGLEVDCLVAQTVVQLPETSLLAVFYNTDEYLALQWFFDLFCEESFKMGSLRVRFPGESNGEFYSLIHETLNELDEGMISLPLELMIADLASGRVSADSWNLMRDLYTLMRASYKFGSLNPGVPVGR